MEGGGPHRKQVSKAKKDRNYSKEASRQGRKQGRKKSRKDENALGKMEEKIAREEGRKEEKNTAGKRIRDRNRGENSSRVMGIRSTHIISMEEQKVKSELNRLAVRGQR